MITPTYFSVGVGRQLVFFCFGASRIRLECQARGGSGQRATPLIIVLSMMSLLSVLVVTVAPSSADPNPAVLPPVQWVAGGSPGLVNGKPSEAKFDGPGCVATSLYGAELFVADYSNNAIRNINLVTGQVRTLARVPKPRYTLEFDEDADGEDALVEIQQNGTVSVLSNELMLPGQIWSTT